MARDSKVISTLEPNTSCDDEDEDNEEEEDDDDFSLHDMGEIVYRAICKDKIACSNFIDILTFATKSNEIIKKLEAQDEEHEHTIENLDRLTNKLMKSVQIGRAHV